MAFLHQKNTNNMLNKIEKYQERALRFIYVLHQFLQLFIRPIKITITLNKTYENNGIRDLQNCKQIQPWIYSKYYYTIKENSYNFRYKNTVDVYMYLDQ